MNLRFLFALWIAKAVALAARIVAPKKGSNIPGEFALKIAPNFLRGFKGISPEKTIFITGTNGKSTSNNLLVHIFREAGKSVCSNLEGANMLPGAATALLNRADFRGRLKDEYIILEIDERSLALVRAQLPAKVLCVANIQKDQVQRNGDPDYIYRKIVSALDKSVTLFANNDEPRSLSLARFCGKSINFGVEPFAGGKDISKKRKGVDISVSLPCPICHDALVFESRNISNIGRFSCPSCGFASAEKPKYLAEKVDFEKKTFAINGEPYPMKYSAAHFLYNYALAIAVASEFGIESATIRAALETFENIGGRFEEFSLGEKTITYIRMKQENPDTLQSALDVIAADKRKKVFLIGLDVVSDIVPAYSNTFYAFDCDFDAAMASGIEKYICFGKTVCYDIANRLRYAGVPEKKILILEDDGEDKIFAEVSKCSAKTVYLLTLLKKFEKLQVHAKQ